MSSEYQPTARSRRVLVVDDDPAVAAVVVEMLSGLGHEATAVPGGRTAIALLPHLAPDTVITDIVMPDGEGMELILHLSRCERRPSIIAMSGNPTGILFLRASELLGVNAALKKPFSQSELAEALGMARTADA